jgi:adenylate cyclase
VGADFRLGQWLVEPSLNTVSRAGASVHLEPKVMEVLVCLARQPGKAVPKDQLLKMVWPETFVTDDALTRSISELRRVFEDDARDPRIIQTIPKRGYRLVATVETCTSPATGVTQESIAVLPFTNMSADVDNEFFADGITEEIINVLSQIRGLRVAARTSCFFFKGKHADMRQIGEQLNVRTVLEGSVRKVGDRLRITAQLVNVADGYHLWSERYDRELKDVFAIQDEIARSIAQRLELTLEGDRAEQLVKAGTKNLNAYQVYLKGRALLYRRGLAIPHAAECFDRAVTLDPDYALAWAGLADCYTTLGYYGVTRPDTCMPQSMEAARRAVAIDPSLAEAHTALAMSALMGAWDKIEAEREFLHALELNPRYIQARAWYALFYLQFSEGRLVEGMEQAKLALQSDPLSSYAHAIYGFTCGMARNFEEGIEVSRRAVELDPESFLARMILASALLFGGQLEESLRVNESALAMSGRHSWSMAGTAIILADLGKPGDADAIYAEMLARARRQYVSPALLALAASEAERQDEAICHAAKAYEIHDPVCQTYLSRHFVGSARLYAYPRFRELLSEVRFE